MKKTSLFLAIIALVAVIGFGFAACESLGGIFPSGASGGGQTANAIGSKGPGGGIVFYDKGNGDDGWRYLEAAPEDLEGSFAWASPIWVNFAIGGTGVDVGAGKVNTATILSIDSVAPAAKAAVDYRGGGLDDWFLPSGEELVEMYKQDSLLKLEARNYWSSSGGFTALENYFTAENFMTSQNSYGKYVKGSENKVRPVRAFLSATQGALPVEPVDQGAERIAQYTWGLEPKAQPSPAGVWMNSNQTTYTFNANGTGTTRFASSAASGWSTENITWRASVNKITVTRGAFTTVYTYEINGNKLTWLDDARGKDVRYMDASGRDTRYREEFTRQ
jgi:hypothetical protein